MYALQFVRKVLLWATLIYQYFQQTKIELFFCLIFMRFSFINLHYKLPVINICLLTLALNVLLHQHGHTWHAISFPIFFTWHSTKWQRPLQYRSEDWTFVNVPFWKDGAFWLLHYSKPRKLPHWDLSVACEPFSLIVTCLVIWDKNSVNIVHLSWVSVCAIRGLQYFLDTRGIVFWFLCVSYKWLPFIQL